MDLQYIRRVAIAAACQGGRVLQSYFGHSFEVSKKGVIDLVTEADVGSEKMIIETIRRVFPDHAILSEESGLSEGRVPCQWIVDPLDGTTNFAHQIGLFSVSIAFALNGTISVGIVLNPITGELFAATVGKGSQLNGRPISVSDSAVISDSLLVTGFPYNLKEMFPTLMARFSKCLKAARGVRRLGSAALDLCFVACGRFDGFWEQNLKPWDTAAGMLIAKEAGASVTDFSDRPFMPDKKEILVTNGKIHDEMLSLLKSEDAE